MDVEKQKRKLERAAREKELAVLKAEREERRKEREGAEEKMRLEREAARRAWGCGQRSRRGGSSRACLLVLLAKPTAAAHKGERRVSGSFSPVDTLLTSRSQWGVPAALPKSCGRVDVKSGGRPGSDEDRRLSCLSEFQNGTPLPSGWATQITTH